MAEKFAEKYSFDSEDNFVKDIGTKNCDPPPPINDVKTLNKIVLHIRQQYWALAIEQRLYNIISNYLVYTLHTCKYN